MSDHSVYLCAISTSSVSYLKVLASPIFIIYYWYKVSVTVHYWGPFIILGYYLITYLVQRTVMNPIVHHIYLQEELEGAINTWSLLSAFSSSTRRVSPCAFVSKSR